MYLNATAHKSMSSQRVVHSTSSFKQPHKVLFGTSTRAGSEDLADLDSDIDWDEIGLPKSNRNVSLAQPVQDALVLSSPSQQLTEAPSPKFDSHAPLDTESVQSQRLASQPIETLSSEIQSPASTTGHNSPQVNTALLGHNPFTDDNVSSRRALSLQPASTTDRHLRAGSESLTKLPALPSSNTINRAPSETANSETESEVGESSKKFEELLSKKPTLDHLNNEQIKVAQEGVLSDSVPVLVGREKSAKGVSASATDIIFNNFVKHADRIKLLAQKYPEQFSPEAVQNWLMDDFDKANKPKDKRERKVSDETRTAYQNYFSETYSAARISGQLLESTSEASPKARKARPNFGTPNKIGRPRNQAQKSGQEFVDEIETQQSPPTKRASGRSSKIQADRETTIADGLETNKLPRIKIKQTQKVEKEATPVPSRKRKAKTQDIPDDVRSVGSIDEDGFKDLIQQVKGISRSTVETAYLEVKKAREENRQPHLVDDHLKALDKIGKNSLEFEVSNFIAASLPRLTRSSRLAAQGLASATKRVRHT